MPTAKKRSRRSRRTSRKSQRHGNMVTIYDALAAKLGRSPTNAELKAEVQRIKDEALVMVATRGKLPHQRKRRR